MRRFPCTAYVLVCFITVGLPIVPLPITPASSRADMLASIQQLFDARNPTPHPAVVQVFVRENNALASGSGTLIHVDAEFGYVLTNWHVVRSAEQQQLLVKFPDGFQSAATVLKTDEKWDLALLRIWRPQVAPMPISRTVPAVGEELVIAGYGHDKYRAARGQCRYYAAPDSHSPQDMIEVSVAARQGDSGGPIVNQHGELAAVLFGSGRGMTTGTHIGRVVSFLNSALAESASSQLAAHTTKTEKTQQTSLVMSGGEEVSNKQPSENESAAAAQQAQYYELPPLEWTTPVDDKLAADDGGSDAAEKNVPIFPGEQTPQPAVAAQLSTPTQSATSAAMATGDAPQNQSITAIDPRPTVALPAIPGGTGANAFGSANAPFGVSRRQSIVTSGFVPTLNGETLAGGEEIITLRDLGGGALLSHLKSFLAIIGIVALLERMRKQ